jgi:hypothetical protein
MKGELWHHYYGCIYLQYEGYDEQFTYSAGAEMGRKQQDLRKDAA